MNNPPRPQVVSTGDEELSRLLTAFLQAPNWADARRTLEEHPELLSDASLALIGSLLAAAQQTDQHEVEAILEQHRGLLLSARAHGISDTFDALTGSVGTVAETDLRALLEQAIHALDQFHRNRDPRSLDAAVDAWQDILRYPAFSSVSADFQTDVLNSAAGTLLERYWFRGDADDLERALDYWQEIQNQASTRGSERSGYLANLATALQARYERTGDVADLERAVATFEEIAATVSPGSPDRPAYLSSLATALQARYERTGDLADLGRGILVSEEAATTSPIGTADRQQVLGNLANGLRLRFAQTGDREDLEHALKVLEEAVKDTPSSSPELPVRLNNLGLALHDRYRITGDESDLDRALSALEAAFEATDSNSPDFLSRLNNVGVVLQARYERTGDQLDLDRAVEDFRRAADLAARSPDRTGFLSNLADTLRIRFELTNEHQDLQSAIKAYRSSCEYGLSADLQNTSRTARNWGHWAAQRGAWPEAATAYRYALEALIRGYQAQPSQGHQAMWLTEAQDVPVEGAYAFAKAGPAVDAVLTLERGRGLLISERITRDADLDRLRTHGRQDLYEQYVRTAQRMNVDPGNAVVGLAEELRETQEVHAELDKVIAEIRQISGFEFFLAPPTFDEIAARSLTAPLAYIAATQHGGMALVVENGEVNVIWLPDLTDGTVRAEVIGFLKIYAAKSRSTSQGGISGEKAKALDHVTRWLWDVLMGPLLERVAFPPRLTLIPIGLLGLLPLHAAWTSETTAPTERRYVLDATVVTYAPNARLLQQAEYLTRSIKASDILGVEGPLPLEAPVRRNLGLEVETAVASFPRGHLLRGEEANRTNVLAAMQAASVLHFACHSYIAPAEPLRSGLLMADGELLTLEDLLNGHLHARLAVLSASGGAIPGTQLPNEVIGLPTGLLHAGVAGVIASQWEVLDLSTAILMVQFYQEWQQGGLEPWDALQRAQRWIRDTTNGEKRDTYAALLTGGQWRRLPQTTTEALYEAIALMDPERRSFADPVHWAGFAYFGL
jgi:CHAT domain/Tetratricopeptide repeat